jgi:hypothetical protein
MRQVKSFLLLSLLIMSIAVMVLPALGETVRAGINGVRPTPAPSPTPGLAVSNIDQTYPELTQPLQTKEQVLEFLQQTFSQSAGSPIWDHPWTPSSLQTEPGRITVEWHADRSYDGSYFGPGAETGPVWVVTIKGKVRINEDNYSTAFDGITYTIGQKTGHVLQVSTGLPISK